MLTNRRKDLGAPINLFLIALFGVSKSKLNVVTPLNVVVKLRFGQPQ
jgi:hypothetical protein